MITYEEKRLQEIRNFEECLQDGFELYTTGRSAIEYHFGTRSLKEVFETAFSSDELKNECRMIADRLLFIIERDTMKHMKKQVERGLLLDEARLFIKRVGIFWQIYELERVIGLLDEEATDRMHSFLYEIDKALANFKFKQELVNLPNDLVASLQNLSIYDCPSSIPQSNRLSQIDSAIYGTHCDCIEGEDPEEKMSVEMMNHVNTLMDDLERGIIPMAELTSLHDNDCILRPVDSTALSTRLFSIWWSLMESKTERVKEGALRILRFVLLSAKSRDSVVSPFHSLYRDHSSDKKTLPSFTQSNLLPEGKKVITAVINDMGSHDEMQRDVVKAERVLAQFHWLVLVSPEEMLSTLLQRCFVDRRIVAPSVRLMMSLPSLSSLPSPSSSMNTLIMTSLISIARSTDYSISDEREALVYLIASLTRQKKNGTDRAVIDPQKVIKLFVTDSIASKSQDKLSVALSLLIRLFSTGETKHTHVHFSTKLGVKEEEGDIASPELLLFLLDLMGKSEQEGNWTIFELTKKTVKQFGSKLREDKVVWDVDTTNFILSRLSNHQWFVKVAVTQWFGSVMGEPKRQIPSGLLGCLSYELTPLFDQIIVPFEFSPVECFLRSLYEVSIWDLPFALSFLDLGVTIPPQDDSMADKMSLAIVDISSSIRSSQWQTLSPFLPLTQRLVNVLDVTIDCRLERINSAIYHSIEKQRALNILARATKLAFITNEEGEDRDNHWALLQFFCSSAKEYIDGEMESWRKFQKMKAKDEFNGIATLPCESSMDKLSSTEYTLTQCSTLFPLAVSLTHIVPKIPNCLQVLLSSISGYLSEFYSRPLPPSLDDAPTGSVPDTTVYAYARGANPIEKGTSVKNPLFDMEGRNRSIGAARSINDSTMSTMIEKKLTEKEEEKKGGGQSSTSGSNKRKNKNGRKK